MIGFLISEISNHSNIYSISTREISFFLFLTKKPLKTCLDRLLRLQIEWKHIGIQIPLLWYHTFLKSLGYFILTHMHAFINISFKIWVTVETPDLKGILFCKSLFCEKYPGLIKNGQKFPEFRIRTT